MRVGLWHSGIPEDGADQALCHTSRSKPDECCAFQAAPIHVFAMKGGASHVSMFPVRERNEIHVGLIATKVFNQDAGIRHIHLVSPRS